MTEKTIEIRSLGGESISVSIEPNKTIQDLKLLLKQSFPLASSSPNFHLFLKGVKLSLQRQISDCSFGVGDFLVFVPFTKKDRLQTQKVDESMTPSPVTNDRSASKLAESSWSNLMQYLSSVRNNTSNNNQPNVESEIMNLGKGKEQIGKTSAVCSSDVNNKNGSNGNLKEGESDDLVLSILQSASNSILDEQNCERFIQVLQFVTCLSDSYSGNCIVRDATVQANETEPCTSQSNCCLCPPWLKDIMKAFTFLNIYHAFLQLQGRKITLKSLEGALSKLGKYGFQAGIADMERLSVLCPKVVCVVDKETDATKKCGALVIVKVSMEWEDEHESEHTAGIKRLPISKVFTAMKRREGSFKMTLSRAVILCVCKNGNEMVNLFSLEDLLNFVKETSRNGSKRARRSGSSPSNSHPSDTRCCDTTPFLPLEMLEHLKRGLGLQGQVVHVEEISARSAKYVEIPSVLSEKIKSALKHTGITKLYNHQAESIQASLARKNVIVATLTSSGKSLCYNLPVLEVLSNNLSACALYLFPTKALAQDQLRALLALTEGIVDSLSIGVYDGDTFAENRIWLRDNARVLITNPDMLHVSILPYHGQFSRILSNLRFIVIDEAHVYKGAFGCHTALILRRLQRLCSHVYGAEPSFIFCTATSANPSEHAMELANLSTIELVKNDGSPSARKLFVLWNPPLCEKTALKRTKTDESNDRNMFVRRSSPILEVSYLFAEMVQHGLRCITFCKTRKLCELVLYYTREILLKTAPQCVESISSYRGGYTAQDRRRIEKDLFSGNSCGIAATNALELGIDVGHVDVTLHLGFPGSVASLWQQAGRSGRRENTSLAIYVAFDGPLDQYFMNFPQKLFGAPVECCHIDATNPQVLEQHLVCAAMEHPLSFIHDEKYFGPCLESSTMTLKSKGLLSSDMSRDFAARIWSYIGHQKLPSKFVSIRAIESERFKVIDMHKDEVIEEIEESRAFFQVYEGAVYMNQGKTYLVKKLDLSTKIAVCQEASLKYYTKTRDYTDVHVTGGQIAYPARVTSVQFRRTNAQLHCCRVTTTWFGFYRISKVINKIIDSVELSLPEYSYESQAVWVRVPQSVKTEVEKQTDSFRKGLHAAGHALLHVVPLYITCSLSDLASECVNPHDTRYVPERLLLYDARPGGTGISAQVQPFFTELLAAALELLLSCQCKEDVGCPSCIQTLACQEYNEVLHKDAAIMIIKGVLDAEESCFGESSEAS